MIKKIFIIVTVLITLNKNNISYASDNKDHMIPVEALGYLLIPRDEELKKKIINQYESLLKQILPNGLISIELGQPSANEYIYKDLEFCNQIMFEENNATFLAIIQCSAYQKIERKNLDTYKFNDSFNLYNILPTIKIAATKNNYIAICSNTGLFLIKPNEDIKLLKGHNDVLYSLSFSIDCKYLVAGGYQDIFIWELENEKDLSCKTLKNEHTSFVTCKFSKGNKYLATSCSEKICLWNMNNLSHPISITTRNAYRDGAFNSIELSNDSKYIIATVSNQFNGKEAKAEIWDIENPSHPVKRVVTNKLGDEKIYIAISNDSQYFITSCHGDIVLWKINNLISGNKEPISNIRYKSLNKNTPSLCNLEFSPNDKYLACNSYNYNLSKFWIGNNLNLDQILVIIILALSNDYEKELIGNPLCKKAFDTFDKKIIAHLHQIFYIRQFLLPKITSGPFDIFNSYY